MIETATSKLSNLLNNSSLQRRFAFTLAILAVASCVATVALMTDTAAVQARVNELRWLLTIDGFLLLSLSIVVAKRVITLWLARHRGRAGAGLQGRLVMLFALIAVTPALLVAVFSYLFLSFGLEAWFNDRVSGALRESVGVTDAYLKEHRENIANQTYSVAYVLNQNAPALTANRWEFNRILTVNATLRELPEAVVIDRLGNMLARSEFALSTVIEEIPASAFEKADKGEVTLLGSEKVDKVRAIVRLNRFVDAYLLVERFVDPRVLQHISGIRQAFDEYKKLEATRSGVQISFVLIYMIAVIILILAAIWIGMNVSAQLAEPVINLIGAAEKVSKGDLSARVDANDAKDEIAVLSHAFNNMTERIDSQQRGLIAANIELDERRHFTEAVLSGVSSGVIGLNWDGRINLPNRTASELLDMNLEDHVGQILSDIVPEMNDLLLLSAARPERLQQAEITIKRTNDHKTFLVRVAAESHEGNVIGYVVTFDDVTELLSAQRKAAWADVARRIAHEIKNPLTPIQLSAERLNRKYLKEITSDKETFQRCTDTIIRQVGDIGRMVDEFSSFARMPQPEIKMENLSEICRQIIFQERNRATGFKYELKIPDGDIIVPCDARQVSRVLTNVLKNAAESIEGAREDGLPDVEGMITLAIEDDPESRYVSLVISDDGRGLPKEQRERLTEPYVTTREKGTGLGLAIVKKIMEEHGGALDLTDREPRGANIILRFPKANTNSGIDRENSAGTNGTLSKSTVGAG